MLRPLTRGAASRLFTLHPIPHESQEPSDKTCQSWGNYDVNTTKFPDIAAFAAALHEDGAGVIGNPLKLSVTVHPDTGVDHCDTRYPQIARAMGVDPASNVTIACDFGV